MMRSTLFGLLVGLSLGALSPVVATTEPQGEGYDPAARLGPPLATAPAPALLNRLTEEVAGVMRCPVCQGLSVADSPSSSALAIKDEVRELLSRGYTSEQVLSYFEQAYGEFIRLEPKAEGFNLVVWTAPILFLLVGLGVVLFRVRRGRGPAARPSVGEDPELEAYLERVREEVAS